MVQSKLPGVQVPAQTSQYWTPDLEALDVEKKKYRAIPVPALLKDSQKHIDERTRMELYVEHLATLEDFDDFDMRKLQGLSPEDSIAQISAWADEVNAAPEKKKANAQRSFGGHLQDFGAAIGRSLLGGVGKVLGAPGISHTLSALSMPGEEVTAQILYNFAKFIPGEQDIERGVSQWKEDNPDAPWWKQGFLTPAVREHGFGVPMGVHLPMEIIFDPLNLIPVGAAFKLAKPAVIAAKLMRAGKSRKEAFRIVRRLKSAQTYANKQTQALLDEVEEAQRLAYETNFDEVGVDTATGQYRGDLGGEYGGGGRSGAEEAGKQYQARQDYDSVINPDSPEYQLLQDAQKDLVGDRGLDGVTGDTMFEQGVVEAYDAANFPGVRGIPNHDGLGKIANDNALWLSKGEDGIKAQWALQLMWHTGIRPHEIQYIRWEDVTNMLDAPGIHPQLILTSREAGQSAKSAHRLLDPEAVKFLRKYRKEYREVQKNPEARAFELPTKRTDDSSEISHLNELFVGAARHKRHSEYGEGLLDFYKNNNNFSYVFRLSKANKVFSLTKKTKGLTDLMKMMGHASTIHTSRYVSFFQHEFDTKAVNILENIADNHDQIKDALAIANKELAEGAWRQALTPEELKKLGNVEVFTTINPGAQNRKGFTDATKQAAITEQNRLRIEILRSSLSKEVDGDLIFPSSIRNKGVKGEINGALAQIQQLQTLALQMQEAVIMKRFIGNIKEVKSSGKGVSKDVRAKLTKIRAQAKADSAQMQEWFQPIIMLADEQLLILDAAVAGSKATKVGKSAYDVLGDIYKQSFSYIQNAEVDRLDRLGKSGAAGVKGAKLTRVDKQFKFLFAMNRVTKTGRPTGAAAKIRKEKLLESSLEPEELEELKQFRETANTGYVIQPRASGTNIKNSGKVMDGGTGAGLPGNPKYRVDITSDHWLITGWKTIDGAVWDPEVNTLQDIGHALVVKLGAKAFKGDRINLARSPQQYEIPIMDLDAWSLVRDVPFSPQMTRMAAHSGTAALTAQEVAEQLFRLGKTPEGMYQNMRHMRNDTDQAFSPSRLRLNKHLLTLEGGGMKYQWSEEVLAAFKKRMDDNPQEHGYGVMNEPPKKPPSRPGERTAGGEIPDGHGRFNWTDHNSVNHTDLSDVIIVPRAMEQVMQWANTEWTKIFSKIPPVLHKPLSKVVRSAVGHTAGATKAAQLRWTFYMSKMEGQEVASNIGNMLEEMHIDLGSNRHNGRGTKLTMKDSAEEGDKFKGINPTTGMFIDDMRINRDYYRDEGWSIGPEHELFDADVAKAMDMGDADQVLGPIALMEAKFKYQMNEASGLWTKTLINTERRKFNHLQVMQDMTTFLNSSRADVIAFYDVTSAAGMKHLAWWDKYHQIMPHLYDLMRKTGFDIDNDRSILGKLTAEFRDSFAPSQLLAQNDELMLQGSSSLGAVPSHMQSRNFHWQIQHMMEQGAGRGIIDHKIFNTDPVIAIQKTVEAYYDWIGRQKFMDEYARLGFYQAELAGHKPIAAALREGTELTDAEQRQAVKFFGANYKSLDSQGLEDRILELQTMSLNWKELGAKELRESAPKEHRLHDTALPENANVELKALIKDVFTPQSGFITLPSMASNMMRLMSTGADLGVMLLHGIGGIGIMASPSPWIGMKQRGAWATGVWNMGKALKDPKVRSTWYTSSQLIRRDMAKYGIGFFRSTHTEDLPLPGVFTKGQYRPALERKGVKQVLRGIEKLAVPAERMMSGFGFFLDVSKTEMWKVQSTAIRRNAGALDDAGQPLDPGTLDEAVRTTMEYELNDLAAAMNAMHGTLQPAVVGLPQKQRVFESAFLMYAALYRRSAMAMVSNLMSGIPETLLKTAKGDLSGAGTAWQKRKWRRGQALASVSGMLMAGFGIGMAIKESGLNDDVFDMGSPDFMAVKVGGMRLGIGTPYYTFVRMAKDIIDQMGEDPGGFGEVNFSDNALLKWFRSGTSPVTSIGIDVLSGADFIGDPLRDTTGGWEVNKIGTRIQRNLMPFWLDSLGESLIGSRELHPSSALAEFFGLRVSPMSPYGRLKAAKNVAILLSTDPEIVKWREETEAAGLPVNGNTIPKLYLERLVDASDEMKALELAISDDVQHRGSYDRKRQDTYIREVQLNREGDGSEADGGVTGLNLKLLGLEEDFIAGLISGRELRQQVELLEAENRGRNQQLAFTFKDVIEHFENRRVDRVNDPEGYFVLDHWYDLYRTFVTSAVDLHDEYGNFDVEMFKVRQKWFREQVNIRFKRDGVEYGWDYIQDRRTSSKLLPETMKRLEEARNETLIPFWELSSKLGPRYADMVNAWRGQHTKEGKAYYQAKHPQVTVLLQRLNRYQDRYRRQNPTVDALLVEFYDYKALTQLGKQIELKRRIGAINAPPATPRVFETPEHPSLMSLEGSGTLDLTPSL